MDDPLGANRGGGRAPPSASVPLEAQPLGPRAAPPPPPPSPPPAPARGPASWHAAGQPPDSARSESSGGVAVYHCEATVLPDYFCAGGEVPDEAVRSARAPAEAAPLPEAPAGKGSAKGAAAKGRPLAGPVCQLRGPLLPITVSLPTTEIEHGLLRQQTVLYVVETTAFGLASQAKRVFEDFETLHAGLAGKLRFILPALPPTYWYGNDASDIVEERRQRLEVLLRKVITEPEAIRDGEETLLRFLGLPRAACSAVRFVSSTPAARSSWLQGLYETTAEPGAAVVLQEPCLQVLLLDLIRGALAEAAAASPVEGGGGPPADSGVGVVAGAAASWGERRRLEVVLACRLLARAFQGAAKDVEAATAAAATIAAPTSPASASSAAAGARRAPTAARAAQMRVMLDCILADRPTPGEGVLSPGPRLGPAAAAAVLTLARSRRQEWSAALAELLDEAGGEQLVEVACSEHLLEPEMPDGAVSSCPGVDADVDVDADAAAAGVAAPGTLTGERLVAEMLLRGFGNSAVQALARPQLAPLRRRLLNRFFVSADPFVRLALGLLLARLVVQDGYAEAAQAGSGLVALYEELLSSDTDRLHGCELVQIFSEDEMWHWLAALAGVSEPAASGFALLVLADVVRPAAARLLETPELHAALLEKVAEGENLGVREPAARLLLLAQRAAEAPSSIAVAAAAGAGAALPLSVALAAGGESQLLRAEAAHGDVGAEVRAGQQLYGTVAAAEEVVLRATEGAERLEAEVRAWTATLREASRACGEADEAHAWAGATVASHRDALVASVESDSRGFATFVELDVLGTDLAASAREHAAGEARLRQLAERRIELTRRLAEQEEARRQDIASSGGPGGGSDAGAAVAAADIRAEAAELDELMCEASEALPAQAAVVAAARRDAEAHTEKHRASLEAWAGVQEQHRSSSRAIREAGGQLAQARARLSAERPRRGALREAARSLAEQLLELDARLAALDAEDADGAAEEAEGAAVEAWW